MIFDNVSLSSRKVKWVGKVALDLLDNATLPTHFTFREESDTLSKIIPIILLKTCESNILDLLDLLD
jgi:hypothetical protein